MVSVADARGYDHKILEQMRIRAIECVHAGEHPVDVARILGVQRQVVYKWLAMYRAGGWVLWSATYSRSPSKAWRTRDEVDL